MNQRRSKKLLKQARKNSRTGRVASGPEYDRLKKKFLIDKNKTSPKSKITKRQDRLVEKSISEASELIKKGEAAMKARKNSTKSKASRWPRVRTKTILGYKTS